MKEIRLFDYQQEMLENITEVFSAAAFDTVLYNEKGKRVNVGSSVMVQMPTGTGKTYVMAAVVKWFLDTYSKGEVWLIAHRKELVEQMEQTLDRFVLEYGEKNEELKAKVRIRVLSIQWLTRNIGDLEKNGFKPGMIIVDEAHHSLATSYQDVFIRNHKALKIGMTATPCRMKQASFRMLFSRLITSPSIKDFILHGYLAPCNYVVIGEKSTEQQIVNLLTDRSGDGDYSVKEMEEKLNVTDVIRRLYNSVVKYAYGKKGIVYAINIDHAKAIAEYYNALGIKAVALDSKTAAKTRKKAVEAFREGELDCLVNVNLFDEGFDCPDVEYIQMARPTLSLAKYLQMVERGLRINKKDPKKVCMIIDNVGNYRKFGLPDRYRDWNAMFEGMMSGRCEVSSYKAEGDGTAETIML
nr:DEAD/DEAH box helicase [Prevotella sp.]